MGVTKDIVRYIGNVTKTPDRAYVGHAFGTLEAMGKVKKSDYGISDTTKVVLMLSRMHWKKGVDLLIDAASKIDDVVFLIAGDGPEIEKYRAQARAFGVETRPSRGRIWAVDRPRVPGRLLATHTAQLRRHKLDAATSGSSRHSRAAGLAGAM